MLVSDSLFSLRSLWIPFSVKPWFARNCYDGCLVPFRKVRNSMKHGITSLNLPYSVGGYISGRAYASLGGTNRRKNAFLTAIALPRSVFPVLIQNRLTLPPA